MERTQALKALTVGCRLSHILWVVFVPTSPLKKGCSIKTQRSETPERVTGDFGHVIALPGVYIQSQLHPPMRRSEMGGKSRISGDEIELTLQLSAPTDLSRVSCVTAQRCYPTPHEDVLWYKYLKILVVMETGSDYCVTPGSTTH